ncbi:adenosine deaminase [Chloroflexota bacterium]
MPLETFIHDMPKVELHVHLEGATQPATLLQLAARNNIELPATTVAGIEAWYSFTDFHHFLDVYFKICDCICTPADIELLAREFLAGQAAQNIRHTEFTYTPYTHYEQHGIPFAEQLAALNQARAWAETELGITAGMIMDISRHTTPEEGITVAEWAIIGQDNGVIALGLGGPEVEHPPEKFQAAFDMAYEAGLAAIPHAGETAGPPSIWGAVDALHAVRIGHGVRCLDDPALVDVLRERQIPLEVNPTSNVCLKVAPTFEQHPLPRLLAEGLYVTVNSDDPPMFNTTLTAEYLKAAAAFDLSQDDVIGLVLNAVRASRLPDEAKQALEADCQAEFARLQTQ